jgi:hypothetical protein
MSTVEELSRTLIDTDNAAGSPSGDVDDAFAIAALLRSGLPVAALTSVGGNTGEAQVDRNNRVLGELCSYSGPYLRGVEAEDVPERIDRAAGLLTAEPLRYVALGPLRLRLGSAADDRASRCRPPAAGRS